MRLMQRSGLLVTALLFGTVVARAQGPAVGDRAPEWTLVTASMAGVGDSLSLSSLRGKTVVMAFFPKARTSGCTIQMRAYRDRFRELFGDGKDVVVIAISRDTPADLASWAADEKFPFRFASDAEGVAGKAYATLTEGRPWESRVLFVIGPDGSVKTVMRPFREIDPTAYDELKAAVRAAN